ncbi:MAG: type II secretion system protein [Aquificae bacterium]|nr:type II secretion system protein [Aquificota bacterium]
MSTFKGFTLVEVLLVLTILGLTFSVLLTVFTRSVSFTASAVERSERLRRELTLFWELQRALAGAKELLLRDGRELFLITSGGERYRGVVKRAFIYRNGALYGYEFPYPAGSLDYYEEDELVFIGRFEQFELRAVDAKGSHASYEGLPELVELKLNGKVFTFKIR